MVFLVWLSLFVQVLITSSAPQAIRQGQEATIQGRTTNARTGAPIVDVEITMASSGRGGVVGSAKSDSTGRYEIHVAPGVYNVTAVKDGFVRTPYLNVANVPVLELGAGQNIAVDFRMAPGGSISGRVTTVDGAPIPDASIQATGKVYRFGKIDTFPLALARTNAQGEYQMSNLPADHYYLQAGQRGIASTGLRAFIPMFYPGVSREENSQAVRLAVGEHKSAVDFRLRDAPRHTVSGQVTSLGTGKPLANMTIRVTPDFPGFGMSATTKTRPDGTFRLEGLTAGRYRMDGSLINDSVEGGPHGHFLRFFLLQAADITNLTIHATEGTTIKGNVAALGKSLPEGLTAQLVFRNPLGRGSGYVMSAPVVATNRTFQFRNAQPGIYDLEIVHDTANGGRPPEFFVEAVNVSGQDVSSGGIRVSESTAPVNVSVTVDFRPGTITGTTFDFENKPIPGANVVVMSADPKKRLLYPFWRQTLSDREGTFRVGSLAPGDYLLLTWSGYRPWAGLYPEAFAILEPHAVRVSVARGGVVSQNLQFTKAVRDLLDALR
jgi:Carboxypeptidase regulatory-like domain